MNLILTSEAMKITGEAMGWLAAAITCIFLIPQIYAILKTKDATDTSVITIASLAAACIFWIMWASLSDIPNFQIIVVNTCCLSCAIFIIGYKIHQYYRDKKILEDIDQGLIKFNNVDIKSLSGEELLKIQKELNGK